MNNIIKEKEDNPIVNSINESLDLFVNSLYFRENHNGNNPFNILINTKNLEEKINNMLKENNLENEYEFVPYYYLRIIDNSNSGCGFLYEYYKKSEEVQLIKNLPTKVYRKDNNKIKLIEYVLINNTTGEKTDHRFNTISEFEQYKDHFKNNESIDIGYIGEIEEYEFLLPQYKK